MNARMTMYGFNKMRVLATMAFCMAPAQFGRADVEVESGFEVSLLATELGPHQVVAGPGINGFTTDLYVLLSDSNTIVRIDESGNVTPFADLSAIVPQGRVLFWPTFDMLGNYGGHLFLDDASNQIYSVDTQGDSMVFSSLGDPWDNDALEFDPYGSFSGTLFLVEGFFTETLYQIGTNGSPSAFATGVLDFSRGITFSPSGGFGDALYLAGGQEKRIYSVAPSHTPGEPASVFIDFDAIGDPIEPITMAISISGPFGTDVMYVNDGSTGRIIKLSPDGIILGTFLTGLADIAEVLLPGPGMFDGTMVVSEVGGSIWIVRPTSIPTVSQWGMVVMALVLLTAGTLVYMRRQAALG